MLRQVCYDLWLFAESGEYGETVAGSSFVAALPSDTVILKAVYLSASESQQASQHVPKLSTADVRLLRPVHSSDGPPFRSALVYASSGVEVVARFNDPRLPQEHHIVGGGYHANAYRYRAIRSGGGYGWGMDLSSGRPGFFLTGTSGAPELWRLSRIEVDAFDRQVLTLAPVRLAHGLAVADFDSVAPPLRDYLCQHYEAFQRAVAAFAHLDMIDRAYNLTEGVVGHCLTLAGEQLPRTLDERLKAARKILDDPQQRTSFGLKDYGYYIAQKIRLLHAESHENRVAASGRIVRPETGMTLAVDVSDLLVRVGLTRD